MFELSIVAVITLALVYWIALWLMGRREDVLYGSFVSPQHGAADQRPEPISPVRSPEWPPELPRRPRLQPAPTRPRPAQPAALQRTASVSASASGSQVSAEPRPDVLASLLEAIKRDLNDAAGKEPLK